MIAGLIRWSARSLLLVFIVTLGLIGGGLYAVGHISLDAIPDLSDTQVIVYTEMPGQAPQVVEDQVTFPLATAMLNVPRARVVRGFSFFGVSFLGLFFFWLFLGELAVTAPDSCTCLLLAFTSKNLSKKMLASSSVLNRRLKTSEAGSSSA